MGELQKKDFVLDSYAAPVLGIPLTILAHMHNVANTKYKLDEDRTTALQALMEFNDKIVSDAKRIRRLEVEKVASESPEGMRLLWDRVREYAGDDEDESVVHEKRFSHWSTFGEVVDNFVETFPKEWDGVIGIFGEQDLGFFERSVRLGTNEVVKMSVRFTEEYWDCKIYR